VLERLRELLSIPTRRLVLHDVAPGVDVDFADLLAELLEARALIGLVTELVAHDPADCQHTDEYPAVCPHCGGTWSAGSVAHTTKCIHHRVRVALALFNGTKA
jgi:hypothetical protein